jgi:hypothetical protein
MKQIPDIPRGLRNKGFVHVNLKGLVWSSMGLSAKWLKHNTAPERAPATPSIETISQLPMYHPDY